MIPSLQADAGALAWSEEVAGADCQRRWMNGWMGVARGAGLLGER